MFSKELINKMVNAMELKKSDVVLIQLWGEDKYNNLVDQYRECIERVTHNIKTIEHSRIGYEKIFKDTITNPYSDEYYRSFDDVNVVIDLYCYEGIKVSGKFPVEKMDIYMEHMGKLLAPLTRREKLIAIYVPTKENYLEGTITYDEYKDALIKAYDIDYNLLKNEARQLAEDLKDKEKVEIITGNNKLELSIKDRKWFIDAGDGDFPCGEIYIAPIEDSANGDILISRLFLEEDILENVIIRFKDGRVVNSSSKVFNEFIKELPLNSDVLAELGIGLNRNISRQTGVSVLDEKAIGTYHIALGMNKLFGGQNDCPFHMDFVFKGEVKFK